MNKNGTIRHSKNRLADQAIQFPDLADAYKEQIINQLQVTPDTGGPSAYQQCVAANAGKCGSCSQSGAFTPCA